MLIFEQGFRGAGEATIDEGFTFSVSYNLIRLNLLHVNYHKIK